LGGPIGQTGGKMDTEKKRTKRIFISDLHLNDNRSLNVLPPYNYPYFWISPERTQLLAKFLENEVLNSDDVKELVILGDLFDQWVVPSKLSPNVTFDAIYNNPQNEKIIENLHKIIDHPDIDVSYAPGNHDMLMTSDKLNKYFKGMKFCKQADDSPYVGVYLQDGIGAEHCSQYSFFCSPNPAPQKNQYLPTGFFLSRYGSEEKANKMESPNFLEILRDFVKDHFKKGDPKFIGYLMMAVGESVGLKDSSEIQLDGIDHFGKTMTVQQVADKYSDAMTLWNQVKPNGLTAADAISTEVDGYSGFAYTQYYKQNKSRITIFGHTHHAMLQGYSVDSDGIPHFDQENGCDYIYANSGTWIDKHPCSFIQTEIRGTSHYVTWFEYTADGKKKMKKERHIFLK
jgi:UDP-2,3-diacylglucosamine pyrophosphatase LpxH